MTPTEPIQAVQHIRKMRGGSQPHLLRASDDHFYVTKFRNNPQHTRILFNEYLATKLGMLLGLPMPEVRIIYVSEWLVLNSPELKIDQGGFSVPCASGLQFASRYVADPLESSVYDYLPESMLSRVRNRQDFPRVLAFDKWTGNADGRQAVFSKAANKRFYKASFIDQGYCFNAGEWDFSDSPLRGAFARNSVYESVTGWDSFEPTLSRIEDIDAAEIWTIVREIPAEWYQNNDEALSRLITLLHQRCASVRDLITGFRKSTRNPFPNWTNSETVRPIQPETTKWRKQMEIVESTLKCVLLLDPETRAYKPINHNLNASLAVEQFSADSKAKIVDQAGHHRSSDPRKCKSCKTAAEEATKQYVEPSPEAGQSEQEPAGSADESESD
jgi:hypothetical protein